MEEQIPDTISDERQKALDELKKKSEELRKQSEALYTQMTNTAAAVKALSISQKK